MRAMPDLSKDIRKRIDIEVALRMEEAQKELDEKVEEIRKEERVYKIGRAHV